MMHNGVENPDWVYHTVAHILACVTHSTTTKKGQSVLFFPSAKILMKRGQSFPLTRPISVKTVTVFFGAGSLRTEC